MCICIITLTSDTLSLKENEDALFEYLKMLASHTVNPFIVLPVDLNSILVKGKHDMRTNPRLELPDDPDRNIWMYFSIMKVTPAVMDDFLFSDPDHPSY